MNARVWYVRYFVPVSLIQAGLLLEDLMQMRPSDAGPSEIRSIKIHAVDDDQLRDAYVKVMAVGREL